MTRKYYNPKAYFSMAYQRKTHGTQRKRVQETLESKTQSESKDRNKATSPFFLSEILQIGKLEMSLITNTVKTCLKWLLKKEAKNTFQDQLSLNAGQKYCRMLQYF